mgnify:FL=1
MQGSEQTPAGERCRTRPGRSRLTPAKGGFLLGDGPRMPTGDNRRWRRKAGRPALLGLIYRRTESPPAIPTRSAIIAPEMAGIARRSVSGCTLAITSRPMPFPLVSGRWRSLPELPPPFCLRGCRLSLRV